MQANLVRVCLTQVHGELQNSLTDAPSVLHFRHDVENFVVRNRHVSVARCVCTSPAPALRKTTARPAVSTAPLANAVSLHGLRGLQGQAIWEVT